MDSARRRRVLIPLTYGLSVRYAVSTGLLESLREVVQPVAALGWRDSELSSALEEMGIESTVLPDALIGHEYRRVTRQLDLLHEIRLRSPTSRIRRRRWQPSMLDRRRYVIALRIFRDRVKVNLPGAEARLLRQADDRIGRCTNVSEFHKTLDRTDADAVLSFTPYHDQDALILLAAQRADLTTMVSIISFDNPTVRGRLPVNPGLVAVWNRQNAEQVLRSHPDLSPQRMEIVGAPQFDLHCQERLIEPEESWRHRLGLPDGRPVILYGAGPSRLVPDELRLVEVLDTAIGDERLPGNPHVLVRPHPADPDDVWGAHRGRFGNVTIGRPWSTADRPSRSWPTDEDLRVQMSSLAHSVVHVNVASSMTVDGAMFDRPQIAPKFLPGTNRAQLRRITDFYRQEHWQPIAASGGLVMAADASELIRAIHDALENPDVGRSGRRRLLEGVLTWPDGRSVGRLVGAVASVIELDADANRGGRSFGYG